MADVGVVLFSPVVGRCECGGSVVEYVFVVEPKFPVRVIVSSKRGYVCRCYVFVAVRQSVCHSGVVVRVVWSVGSTALPPWVVWPSRPWSSTCSTTF